MPLLDARAPGAPWPKSEATLPPKATTIAGKLRRLVWLMLVPATAISLLAAFAVYRAERGAVVEAALETARALSLVTDREMAVRAAVLQTLATSPLLATGNLEAFHREAMRAVPSPENSIVLIDPAGRQVLNTRIPFGQQPGLNSASFPAPDKAPLQPIEVSNLYLGALGKQHSFGVRVPVLVDGQLRWTLGMGSFASQMQKIFEQQPLPPNWLGVVLDGQGYVAARTLEPEKRVGARASENMRRAMGAATQGVIDAETLDGVPVFTVFSRAPQSGWTVLIGLQREELRGAALRAFTSMMAISLAFIGLTLLAALRVARTIVHPLHRLQADAQALGRGAEVHEAPTGLAEADTVQRLLAEASQERANADERLRKEVAQAVATAELANQAALRGQKLEALGRLTGGIAHDFNNLLQTMTTGLQLAARLTTDPRAQKALAASERATAKAVTLTRQLMTFGRSQSGHDQVLDVARQLAGWRELIQGAMSEAVVVTLAADPLVKPVRVDPVQLELAVLNLALNARDAMQGRGALSVTASNRRVTEGQVQNLAPGDYVAIAVKDTGEGMTPELAQRVFEPFFTTKEVGKGSGLGLSQVYGFAQKSGGLASIASQPGVGTEVTIWLPRSDWAPVAEREGQAAAAPAQYRGTVLFVEDDAAVRELTSAALQEFGFDVVLATQADEALQLVRERRDIDVVLSDIVMPGERSGVDLAATLKTLRPALPVLLASGHAERFSDELGVPLVAKPYDVEKLARQLGAMVSASASSFADLQGGLSTAPEA